MSQNNDNNKELRFRGWFLWSRRNDDVIISDINTNNNNNTYNIIDKDNINGIYSDNNSDSNDSSKKLRVTQDINVSRSQGWRFWNRKQCLDNEDKEMDTSIFVLNVNINKYNLNDTIPNSSNNNIGNSTNREEDQNDLSNKNAKIVSNIFIQYKSDSNISLMNNYSTTIESTNMRQPLNIVVLDFWNFSV